MSLTKVQINLGTSGNLSGSRSLASGSLSSRITTAENELSNTLVSGSAQLATDISGSFGNQRVGTTDSPVFNAVTVGTATVTGTLTAQEVHTEFESASILFTSGSTKFGDTIDDTHEVTGSMTMSGSVTVNDGNFIVTDKVGFGTNNPSNVLHLEFNDDSDVFTPARITDNSVSGILINNLDTGNGHGGMIKFANKNGDNHTAIAHSQDGNTDASLLFYSMDGGTLAEVMRVDHTHRVGIGNGAPATKLHIGDGTAGTNLFEGIRLQGGSDNGKGASIGFMRGSTAAFYIGDVAGLQGGSESSSDIAIYALSGNGTRFYTNGNNERLRITSDGKVGINEPSPDHKLHLTFDGAVAYNGSTDLDGESIIKLEGTSADGEAVMIRWANHGSMNNYFGVVQDGASGQGHFVFTSYNGSAYGERMRITSAGNVGINTNSPSYLLHVRAADGDSDNNAVARFENLEATAGRSKGVMITAGSSADDWPLHIESAGGSDLARVTGRGDLSLGSTVVNRGGMNRVLEVHGTNDVEVSITATGELSDDARIGQFAFYTDKSQYNMACIIARVSGTDENRGEMTFHTRGTESGGTPSERWRIKNNGDFIPGVNNTYDIGDTGDRVKTIYSQNALDTSDRTLKKNINDCDLGLTFVNTLKPKSFYFNDTVSGSIEHDRKSYGLIAQDLIDTPMSDSVFGEKDGEYNLRYNDLFAPMIKAIQQLTEKNEALEKRIEELKK